MVEAMMQYHKEVSIDMSLNGKDDTFAEQYAPTQIQRLGLASLVIMPGKHKHQQARFLRAGSNGSWIGKVYGHEGQPVDEHAECIVSAVRTHDDLFDLASASKFAALQICDNAKSYEQMTTRQLRFFVCKATTILSNLARVAENVIARVTPTPALAETQAARDESDTG